MHLLTLKNILVATRLDDSGEVAVRAASELASAAGATLHVAFVASTESGAGSRSTLADHRNALRAMLARAGAECPPEHTYVLEGDPAVAIGSIADRLSADVVVLGPHAHKPRASRRLEGTALAVVTNASSPCLVISKSLRLPLRRVLVPVDVSDTARGALLVGLSWASALRSPALENSEANAPELTALHVQTSPGAGVVPDRSRTLERELEYVREQAGTWAAVTIGGETTLNSDATRGITDYVAAHAPDLVVMGTRGLGLDPIGRIGSVTAAVVESVDVPMLLVPPAVWMAHAANP